MSTYKVKIEPVEDGFWMASVPAVQGCRTQAKTLVLAKRRIRDALGLFVNDAEKAKLEFEVNLPGEAKRSLAQYKKEAAALIISQRRAKEAAKEFVELTAKRLHMPVREVAELMGVSHQRVDQIARYPKRTAHARSG